LGGWEFHTDCDTEVLLAAYATHGPACLPKLRGMFAFAVWDVVARTLFAARDGLGIKPLYYARLPDGGLAFGSEVKVVLASGLIEREIDPAAVGEYLARFSVAAPRTILSGVLNLPPGHQLELDAKGRVATGPWWHLPSPTRRADRSSSREEFIRGLRGQLEDTIRAHQVADVPVGAFLSGGLDSSAVVGLMHRAGSGRLRTFSVVFEDPAYSEAAAARATAEAFGTEHHEFVLTGSRVAEDLPRIVAACDQPTGDGINTYYASLAAREGGVKVALSGLGGDELFGGYPSFRQLPRLAAFLPVWRRLPRRVRHGIVRELQRRPSARARKLADFLGSARDLHELASLQRRVLPEATRLALLSPDARESAVRLGPHHPMLDDFIGDLLGADTFQIVSAWELRTYMADVLLRDSDVFSLAHSLELRVPFVDTHLLAWLWTQPAVWKHTPEEPKRALADAVADIVPEDVRRRRKQGFTLPFDRWMRAELRPFLEECFSPPALGRCPWLDAAAVARLWREYLAGTDPRAWSRVWTVAMLVAVAGRRGAGGG
jgi:asparagine synthase (glutamine-hydrolysing)